MWIVERIGRWERLGRAFIPFTHNGRLAKIRLNGVMTHHFSDAGFECVTDESKIQTTVLCKLSIRRNR